MSPKVTKLARITLAATLVAGATAVPARAATPEANLQRLMDCSEGALTAWQPTSAPSTQATVYQVARCATAFAGRYADPYTERRYLDCMIDAAGSYVPIGGFEGVVHYGILCTEAFLGYDLYVDPGRLPVRPRKSADQRRRPARRTRSQLRLTRSR